MVNLRNDNEMLVRITTLAVVCLEQHFIFTMVYIKCMIKSVRSEIIKGGLFENYVSNLTSNCKCPCLQAVL